MATDFRIVTPDDIGSTLKLGAKEANKYDVDVSQLTLPAGIDSFELAGTTLTAKTSGGDKSIDLAPMLPTVTASTFLKNVVKTDNKIVFTVGEKGSATNDTTFEIDVSDLLPVQTDNATVKGDGTTASPLNVAISVQANNALIKKDDGLYVTLPEQQNIPSRDVRLVNASGQTVIGYLHSTEQ